MIFEARRNKTYNVNSSIGFWDKITNFDVLHRAGTTTKKDNFKIK